ncbi:hypothetical protein E2P81_ATG09152 [Venturia nashicola]|nr:hypothetical protein E2P81_ATG09152 [Venturia nashicola]
MLLKLNMSYLIQWLQGGDLGGKGPSWMVEAKIFETSMVPSPSICFLSPVFFHIHTTTSLSSTYNTTSFSKHIKHNIVTQAQHFWIIDSWIK